MEKPGIIGCGTMGHSIALAFAWAGIQVKLHGINATETGKAQLALQEKLEMLASKGLLKQETPAQVLGRISITHSMEEIAADSTFIIETIPEDLVLKRDLFRRLDQQCSAEVILATNTSGLPPTAIAAGTLHPERVVATHFWNPAHLIPLVEVIRGEKTSDDTVNRAIRLLSAINKKPIEVKKEVPGFVGNRLQFALLREAQYLLEQGIASKEDIDAAVTNGIGRRLSVTGPLMSADLGGLDIFLAISDYLFSDLSNAKHASPALKEMVAANHLGAKTGDGYYTWNEELLAAINQEREEELIRHLSGL